MVYEDQKIYDATGANTDAPSMAPKVVAEPTTEHTAWDCDQPKCGIPVSADQREILTRGAGLSALQQLRVQSHLIADVERLQGEIDERARLAEQREELEATLQADVKALTEQLGEATGLLGRLNDRLREGTGLHIGELDELATFLGES